MGELRPEALLDLSRGWLDEAEEASGHWGWLALRGVGALVFGVLTLVWPGLTLDVLVVLWGVYALFDGVSVLIAVVGGSPATRAHRPWHIISGVAGITAGVLTFVWPGITALALLYVIAAWATVAGVMEIATALRLRKEIGHHWLLGLNGILLVAFAIVLVAAPVAGALAITWLIGWWAIVFGALLLAAAWRARRIA
jgi:uncharacterized membrane protein HdeD (DUF308 family)